jgi:hypothetical protein
MYKSHVLELVSPGAAMPQQRPLLDVKLLIFNDILNKLRAGTAYALSWSVLKQVESKGEIS